MKEEEERRMERETGTFSQGAAVGRLGSGGGSQGSSGTVVEAVKKTSVLRVG